MQKRKLDLPAEYRELANEFATWYIRSKPGDRFVYYFSEWLHDSMASEFLRKFVWEHACEGKVYIFQTRDSVERNKFNFIAIKPKERIYKLIPLSEASEKRR